MFLSFFFLLRRRGLHVSLNEWMVLLDALSQGLHRSSLTGFYHLCRAVVVHSEMDFDKFDQAFLEYFDGVPFEGDIPDEVLDWLNKPEEDLLHNLDELRRLGFPEESLQDLLKMLEERLKEQTEEHNGGAYWVGTGGRSAFGHGGWHPNGIRIGGESRFRTAMSVAGERHYRDFRKDNTLDTRQFQVAFRTLRHLSVQSDSNELEFDVDGTIRDTCDNAGRLKIRYKKPRKNTMKVLMLMDSGGSMSYYAGLCSQLFQAATASNHFKELHTFYFHNIIYEKVYQSPVLRVKDSFPLEYLLNNFDDSYRVIIVGDAAMNPHELHGYTYSWHTGSTNRTIGLESMLAVKRHFPYCIWLNPEPMPTYRDFWSITHLELAEHFPMYDLSIEGLEEGLHRLLTRTS